MTRRIFSVWSDTAGRIFGRRRERQGIELTPVDRTGHVAILGWTNRTLPLVVRLLEDRRGPLNVAILVEQITTEMEQSIRQGLGPRRTRVELRAGDPERPEELARVLGRGPEAVVLPGCDRPGCDARAEDPRALKILAHLGHALADARSPPRVIAEIADSRRLPVAHKVCRGGLDAIPTRPLVGRSLAMGILAPGLTSLYGELLGTRRACSLCVRKIPTLAGGTLAAGSARFSRAVLLGILRADGGDAPLDTRRDTRVREDDRLLLVAPCGETPVPEQPGDTDGEEEGFRGRLESARPLRVLLLGWSHKAPALCWELGRQGAIHCQVDVVSEVEIEAREAALGFGAHASRIQHFVGDPTTPDLMDVVDLQSYDRVVLIGSDDAATAGDADSRTLASAALVDHSTAGIARRPHLIAELLDPANAPPLENSGVELVITPQLLAGVLARAVRHPELAGVLEFLLQERAGRPGVVPVSAILGDRKETSFASLERWLGRRGVVCLGLQREVNGMALELAPDKRERLPVGPRDRAVIVWP